MTYRQEVVREKSLMRDSVWEMMTELQYQAFAAKAKNGAKTPAIASQEWNAFVNAENAIVDNLGPNVTYKVRVTIKVKDLLVDREAESTRQIVDQRSKDIKNASEDCVQSHLSRLQSADLSAADAGSDRVSSAKGLIRSLGHGQLMDDGSSSAIGEVQRKMGELKQLVADLEPSPSKPGNGQPGQEGEADDNVDDPEADSKLDIPVEKLWFERETKLEDARKARPRGAIKNFSIYKQRAITLKIKS